MKSRELLIYLWLYFNKSSALVWKEIIEKNMRPTRDDINAYFLENDINPENYIAFTDEDYPYKEFCGFIIDYSQLPPVVIEK